MKAAGAWYFPPPCRLVLLQYHLQSSPHASTLAYVDFQKLRQLSARLISMAFLPSPAQSPPASLIFNDADNEAGSASDPDHAANGVANSPERTPLLPRRDQTGPEQGSRNVWSVPAVAVLIALIIGMNSGYVMAVNTTRIGQDMRKMQQAVQILIIPLVPETLIPTMVPLFRSSLSQEVSFSVAAAFAVCGLALNCYGSYEESSSPEFHGLAQAVLQLGSTLLNLLIQLALKDLAEQNEANYFDYRAKYVGVMNVAKCFGALGGPTLIDWLETNKSNMKIRPWGVFFIPELALTIALFVYSSSCSFIKHSPWDNRSSGEHRATTSSLADSPVRERDDSTHRKVWNVGETFGIGLVAFCMILMCSFFASHDDKRAVYPALAAILPAAIICAVGYLRPKSRIFSAKVLSCKPLLLIAGRATMSPTVQTLLYRIPIFAQISLMIINGLKDPLLCPTTVQPPQLHPQTLINARFSRNTRNTMLPIYYCGELLGAKAAATAMARCQRRYLPLAISLFTYWLLNLLFSWTTGILTPATLLLLAGAAQGSADNCFSGYLLDSVDVRGK